MKKITSVAIRSLLIFLLLGVSAVLVNLVAFPSETFAAETVVQTKRVLPPGGSSCPAVTATNFTPYIYDGALHSFEFSVSDSSYVALTGTVGDTVIPFQLMTRRVSGTMVRIHVDIEATSIRGSLPITVTLLSSKQGQPTCLMAIANVVPGPQIVPTTPVVTPTTPTAGGTPAKPVTPGSIGVGTSTIGTTTVTSTPTPPTVATTTGFLENMCASGRAPAMWFILLVVYGAFVWAATSGKIKISFAQRLEWTAAAIIVPLILLLALWYFPASCRAEAWVPAVGIVIALAALLSMYGSRPEITKTISLPAARPNDKVDPPKKTP